MSQPLCCGDLDVWVVIAALGLFATMWLGRALSDDPWVRRLVVASYVVRVGAAATLYFISLWGLPALAGAQFGNMVQVPLVGMGFWDFARDAATYNRWATVVADAWRTGSPVQFTLGPENPVIMYVAGVYRLFGDVPLNVSILNAWYGALTALAAAWMVQRYQASAFSVRATALLVGFWPSGILWSTQVLKDSFVTAVVVGLIVLTAVATRARRANTAFIALLSAAALMFLLSFARSYLAGAMVAAMFVFIVPWAVADFVRSERRRARAAFGAALFMLAGLGLAAQIPVTNVTSSAGWGDLASVSRVETSRATTVVPVWRTESELSDANRAVGAVRALAVRLRNLPAYLGVLRQGLMAEPGRSVLDPDVTIATWSELLRYLPRGLAVEFLAPFPWDWLSPGRPTGYVLAGVENLLIYALLPCAAMAAYRLLRKYDPALTVAAITIAMLAVGYAIVIPSVGTLFRLRFPIIVLALLVMGCVDAYADVYGRLLRVTPRSPETVSEC